MIKFPWYIRKIAKTARDSSRHIIPPFEGVYENFPKYESAWEAEKWRGRVEKSINLVKSRSTQIPEPLSHSKTLLPVLLSAYDNPSILDIGGGAGVDHVSLRSQGIDTDYHVLEIPSVCAVGRELCPEITFHEKMPAREFDIVYSFSALQCIEDYKQVFHDILSANPKAVLLCQIPMYAGKTFARLQKGYGPQWVFGLNEVKALLPGFKLAYRGYSEHDLNVDNFKPPFDVGYTVNLLFTRQNPQKS